MGYDLLLQGVFIIICKPDCKVDISGSLSVLVYKLSKYLFYSKQLGGVDFVHMLLFIN